MSKHPKKAYGIVEDGQTLRLVCLVREGYQVSLLGVEKVELERPLYQSQEELAKFEQSAWEDNSEKSSDLKLDEFDSQYLTGFKLTAWDRLFSAYNLSDGVIALNVNDENVVRSYDIPPGKRAAKLFAAANLSPQLYKSGQWQTSLVENGHGPQIWLHKGENQLLSILTNFAQRNKKRLFYQLADVNDIALADYFRVNYLKDGQRALLVYLGKEFRKAFLFENGAWVNTLPLNITQDLPEAELIYSRISFALDSAQQTEPEEIVLCGDLATPEVVNYINQQGTAKASLLTFPQITLDSSYNGLMDDSYIAQFTLPIALAYKALFPDELRFTPSNFLPKHLLEAQKPFTIAWHGYLVMFAIFCAALLGTLSYLNARQDLKQLRSEKRQLDYELTVSRIEAKEIKAMKDEMQNFEQNIQNVRTVLKGKNPWSSVLDTLNRLFRVKPVSWLTNFKKDTTRLMISGYTTNRRNVLDFADALPNSRIQKVTNSKIRNTVVWSFEITSDFPDVDWVARIEAEMQAILDQQNQNLEETTPEEAVPAESPQPEPKQAVKAAEPAKPAVPPPPPIKAETQAKPQTSVPAEVKKLPPIRSEYMPQLSKWQNKTTGQALTDYNEFIRAINRENMAEYKPLGLAYLKNYQGGRLYRMVRWHLAYRLYKAGDYTTAIEILDPLVHEVTSIYPHSLLLSARIDYARHKKRYAKLYESLQNNYPDHQIAGQVKADLAVIGEGGGQ